MILATFAVSALVIACAIFLFTTNSFISPNTHVNTHVKNEFSRSTISFDDIFEKSDDPRSRSSFLLDIAVIGFAKCGTSTMMNYLSLHPGEREKKVTKNCRAAARSESFMAFAFVAELTILFSI